MASMALASVTAVALAAVAVSAASAPAVAAPDAANQAPDSLTIPGANFFPESVAATSGGDLFVSSIVTGEIVRFAAPLGGAPTTFVAAGVNPGTAGIIVDPLRDVLWACAGDRGFQGSSSLRAFELSSGRLVAQYPIPDGGVCADVAIAGTAVYVTDSTNPAAARPSRILRLTAPAVQATGGQLVVWSADPAFTGAAAGPQLNGIAFDGQSALFTTNQTTGRLYRVPVAEDGSPGPVVEVPLAGRFINPDGIRALNVRQLLVTENSGRLNAVDVNSGDTTVIGNGLNQPTSVVPVGRDMWVAEGQALRLRNGQQPTAPFTLRRVPLR